MLFKARHIGEDGMCVEEFNESWDGWDSLEMFDDKGPDHGVA